MSFDFTKEPGKILLNRELNNKGQPLVSIITPYYNASKYFEQTFNSVLNQTFPWFEWIIVDDGSTNTDDIIFLEQLTEKDKRILVLHKNNGGPASARNFAIQNTTTEIVVSLDSDDLIEPTFIETIYFALKFNPDAAWAYTDSIGFQNQEYTWKVPFDSERIKTENFLIEVGAIRRNILLEVDMYDQREKFSHEDWHLWMKILAKGYHPIHLGYYGAWYRRVEDGAYSMTLTHQHRQEKALQMIKEEADKITNIIKAREFPCNSKNDKFLKPVASDWERKLYKQHNKINVLMIIPWMEMGGADLFNLELVNKIDRDRFEVGIITTVMSENTWRQRFEESVTDIFELPTFLDKENYPEFISYFIKSREIDVLFISNSYYGYYLVPWLRKEFPQLAIIDYVHMEEWYWRNGGFARTSGVMGDILDKTLVCNERTRRVMVNEFGRTPQNVETLYIGVDKDKFNSAILKGGTIKEKFGISGDRPVILFPCRIHPQKRPFLMLEIAEKVRESIPNIAFMVVGDGPQLDDLKNLVREKKLYDTVYFAGRQNDMRPYYRDSNITLICSLKEGLALTAYESLSMGVPVISSNVGGQAELIDDKVGAIIPLLQKETEDLDKRVFLEEEVLLYVNSIKMLLNNENKYREMCKECRKRIELGFSSDLMINKLEKIFEYLLKDNDVLRNRINVANSLLSIKCLTNDLVSIYNEYEIAKHDCDEIWQTREWFRRLYEEGKCKINSSSKVDDSQDSISAQRRLEEIYRMRSWKIVEKYIKFMDTTFVGSGLRKIRDLFR